MIYEFRTYALVPGGLPEFLSLFSQALPKREEFSTLAAFWYTEIGPLDEVVHVWPYKDAAERVRVRAAAVQAQIWPPPTGHLIRTMRSDIFDPVSDVPAFPASVRTGCVEISTQVLKPFALAKCGQSWAAYARGAACEALLGVFASDIGGLNTSMQIWAHRDMDAWATGRGGPMRGVRLEHGYADSIVYEERRLMVPAPFSRY